MVCRLTNKCVIGKNKRQMVGREKKKVVGCRNKAIQKIRKMMGK